MEKILNEIVRSERIVVKVGTSTLTYPTGKMNLRRIDRIARILSDLTNRGKEIILVSSGAIGIAKGKLNLRDGDHDMRKKQAIAAVGQCELMYLYDKLFSEYNNTVAQILLTRDDIAIPRRKRNTQNTMSALLEMGIIPVVNENDTVATDEIEIGDNDTLSAIVAAMTDADLLILFSDIEGLYDSDPHINKNARLMPVVYDTDEVMHAATGSVSGLGTGGMVTKLEAAKIAADAGVYMVIANGEKPEIIYDLLEGRPGGTIFVPGGHSERE
ncbi:MAG: glutamate 5-kinase [Oscillospiraceae bacterium]|nr:glutamate 5-kinase [Oscillospiraceae bacterium]